jgi:penicillin amidase
MLLVIVYIGLRGSLPDLNTDVVSINLASSATLSRDAIGTAVIEANSEYDAAYVLGYAHAQDRLFQMDLLRRQAAGELSEIVGIRALNVDKKHRFHQFRDRAQKIFETLPKHQQAILLSYTNGVNDAARSLSVKPFEYILTSSKFAPWKPADSLLASYSMYIDLQLAQTEIDFRLSVVDEVFGEDMYHFFTLPSNYQAAIDGSIIEQQKINIPRAPLLDNSNGQSLALSYHYDSIEEQADIGSNNWAVAGDLTPSDSAMLSNDMHLGLSVPSIWYRAQINYTSDAQSVSVTGVSLPGTPAIIVGANKHIAWGFTNSNVDNVDWIKLNEDTLTTQVSETISTPDGSELFSFEMSKYGPVRQFNGSRYALKWVAHQPYAVNMQIAQMAKMTNVADALELAKSVRIPAQNMVIADSGGKIAWQLTGAMTQRKPLDRKAISESQYSELWEHEQQSPAHQINPAIGRVWSANARVVSTKDLAQFGDGGYALGARQEQIVSLLMEKDNFVEKDFYDIQLNNEALFLVPWQQLLLDALNDKSQKYSNDIEYLKSWGKCACADSVGYTLVRRFRSELINQLFAPVNIKLEEYQLSTSYIQRSIEPAVWALIQQQADDWLPTNMPDYTALIQSVYDSTVSRLKEQHGIFDGNLEALAWGQVNMLRVKHPFSSTLGPFSSLVDMPEVLGFGDSFLPAVQANTFGASQRLIVRPGNLEDAILTIPGGQSGHFLSPFYRKGFDDYAKHASTPLLPQRLEHVITFTPSGTPN